MLRIIIADIFNNFKQIPKKHNKYIFKNQLSFNKCISFSAKKLINKHHSDRHLFANNSLFMSAIMLMIFNKQFKGVFFSFYLTLEKQILSTYTGNLAQ